MANDLALSLRGDDFLQTDERQDVISSLQMTLATIQLAHENPIYWKWVVLALHSALQGAMVCHLNRSDSYGASNEIHVKKWYDWHDSGRKGKEPKVKMALPTALFNWISDPSHNPGIEMWKSVKTTKNRQDAFKLLHKLRNTFTHYNPILRSIEIAGLPNMVSEIVAIIDEICQIGWAFLRSSHTDKELIDDLIKAIKLQVPK